MIAPERLDERTAPAQPVRSMPTGAAPRRRMRRPSVSTDEVMASAALLALGIATAIGMCRVFSDWTFLRPMIEMLIAVHAIALVLRVLRVPALIALPLAVLAVYEAVALIFYSDTMNWLIPGRETFRTMRIDLRLVWTQFPSAVAPVPSVGGYIVAATIGIGLVAVLADAFAFRAYGRAEAVVPSGVLFVFTAALGTSRNRIAVTALWLGLALVVVALLRALHGGSEESWLGRRGRAMRAAVPSAAGLAVAAAVVAAIVGPHVPGAGSKPLLDTRHSSNDVTEVLSPLVDIRSRLINRSNVEMFTVEASAPRYWRVSGLSLFDGTTWGLPDRTLKGAGGDLNPIPPGATLLQQRITISRLGGKLVPVAFMPVRISERNVRWLPGTDTLVLDGDVLQPGDVFDVSSVDLDPGADVLRQLSTDGAPQEYLDLPASFPDQVRDVAERVTANAPTAYDKMIALQDWFHATFQYDPNVQAGHSDDAMLAFLRIRKGYCEQFSGTFAAMARSLGIPSRVAVGFTQGILQSDGKYHVYGKQSHAWPEIWFDGIGWVAFEPTPGRGEPGAEATTGLQPSQNSEPLPNGNGGAGPGVTSATVPVRTTPITDPEGPGGGGTRTSVASTTSAPPITVAPAAGSGGGPGPGVWLLIALGGLVLWMLLMPVVIKRFLHRTDVPTERVVSAWNATVGALAVAGAPPIQGATPLEWAVEVERNLPIDQRSLSELARFVTRAVYAPAGVGEPVALRATVLQVHLQKAAADLTPWYTRLLARLDPRLARMRLVGDPVTRQRDDEPDTDEGSPTPVTAR